MQYGGRRYPWLLLAFSLLPCLFLGLSAGTSQAASAVFGPEAFTGWADLRLSSADGEQGWLKGGYGKLRYGGKATNLDLAQAAVLWTPQFSSALTANVLIQDVPDARKPFGVSEAYLTWQPIPRSATRYGVRLGQMFAPLSLENDGPGWTTTRTLTPSAINSWVGEELLVDGIEGHITTQLGGQGVGGTFGLYTSGDTAGTILAFRGWAEHDLLSDGNTELPLPEGYGTGYSAVFRWQAPYSKPMVEVDGRMGYYVRLDWQPTLPVALHLAYLYNPGTPTIVVNGQYGWTTRLIEGGVSAPLSPKDQLLSQILWGRTKMGGLVTATRHAVDVSFDSAYVLVAHNLDDGAKLSARADYFEVVDDSWVSSDNNNEKGYSATVAWTRPLSAHIDLILEAVHLASHRPARLTQFANPDQAQNQIQMALKLYL